MMFSDTPTTDATAQSKASTSTELGVDGLGTKDTHVAHVRCVDGDDHLRLQLRICNDRKTFFRPVGEKLDKIRNRLQLLASHALASVETGSYDVNATYKDRKREHKRNAAENKKLNMQGNSGAAKIAVRFFADEDEFTAKSTTIGEALMRTTRIVIGNDEYVVLRNQPVVLKIAVMDPVLAGIPIIPLPETEFCHPDECQWRWHRIDADGSESVLSDTRRYVPTSADLGCRFRIECHAPSMHSKFAQESAAEIVTTAVIPGPDRSVFAKRKLAGSSRCSIAEGAFRVMDYNVLYDGYTTTLQAKTALFPYAKPEVMTEMYRMQLVFQEIEENQADIICIQEMGQAIFYSFFEPMMGSMGFHAYYAGKTGTTQEGCAVFIRKSCFDVLDDRIVDLSMAVQYSQDAEMNALLAELPEIAKGIRRIPSIAQVLVLRDRHDPTRRLVLVNTHLFYREDGHMIRLVQTLATVREIERVRASLVSEEAGHVGVLFCGDFNAYPHTAPIDFLLAGSIDEQHPHWQSAPSFVWKRLEGKAQQNESTQVSRGRLAHSLDLESTCGLPAFTNYAATFQATLDYILVSKQELCVRQMFPLFTVEEVCEEVAMPSSKFPSDHLSLIVDVQWK
ncbi:hypothetical protein Poli38472_006739 [Pythium oligandrum]|uniref:Endonuclease/exonuclease/phosphatase domain-containing protein n=1 Tax=Pythium oligandrum TaxID=41045 RepID=A0A8K1FDC2_PYTOL|nr:hypothetical protein Poli38472_006739 [Pythium oligandrum]|eukprot:TMW56729.1 hypothetical protein Poli38472_006739 [Pythium oligandrum]